MIEKLGLVGILIIIAVIGFWIGTYMFHDCKKVGHATMYCVFNLFK